jgi:hypothetical protein
MRRKRSRSQHRCWSTCRRTWDDKEGECVGAGDGDGGVVEAESNETRPDGERRVAGGDGVR